jgi:hypothetical protein
VALDGAASNEEGTDLMLPDYLAITIALPCLIWATAGAVWFISRVLQDQAAWALRLASTAYVPTSYPAYRESRENVPWSTVEYGGAVQKNVNVPWRAQA